MPVRSLNPDTELDERSNLDRRLRTDVATTTEAFGPAQMAAQEGLNAGVTGSPGQVLALQRLAGNHAVGQLTARTTVVQRVGENEQPSPPSLGAATDLQLRDSNWSDFFDGFTEPLNDVRAVLEIGRAIPAIGIVAGLEADAINAYQDLSKFDGTGAPSDSGFTESVVGIRDACMIVNNVIGALAQTDQVAQDAATASIIGTPLIPVTASVQEGLKGVKVWFDAVQLQLDVIALAAAHHHAMQAPGNPEQLKWANDLFTNYEANIVGDFVTTVLDVVDAGTAGYTNCEVIHRSMSSLAAVFKTGTKFAQGAKSVLLGLFGVYGGGMVPRYVPTSGAVQRDVDLGGAAAAVGGEVAADAILGEVAAIRATYAVGDGFMAGASGILGELLAALSESMTRLLGGQDPARLIVDNTHQMLERLHGSIAELTEMGVFAGTAQEKSGYIISVSDEALATLDRLVVPDIHVDHMEDDGILAGVVNAGADLADTGFQAVVGQVREVVESAKAEARQPLLQVRGHADQIALFCQFLQEHTKQTIELFNAKIASFDSGLARCQTFGDIANLIIAQIAESLGLGEGFSVGEIMREWEEIPRLLDAAEQMAHSLRAGRTASSDGNPLPGPEAGAAGMPPPPPEDK